MPKQTDYLKKGAEAPAIFLERTVATTEALANSMPNNKLAKKTKDYWHQLGPGLTTGASDDDPSGIATYSQTGAQTGFHLLWLSTWTFPLMAVVQEMCARIGLVTGRGLAGNIRLHYSKKVLYACAMLLFVANCINIGADLGAMAQAVQILNPKLNFYSLVIGFTVLSLGLQIFTPYVRYAKYLKWLALVLFSYVASALMAHLDWNTILQSSYRPHINFTKDELIIICAILGTTISPYLFFWQTSQEVEEQILQGKTTLKQRRSATPRSEIRSMRVDVWSGMFLSNAVMFFIIAACGGVLYSQGITNIDSAAQAAEALRPFAGDATFFLFAVGIIGTGLLAIPVLAGSSSYVAAESFRWREGLYNRLGKAYAFYGVIIISMLAGMAMNFIGLDPIKALIYAAIANGLVAPIVLFFIVRIASDKKIMGHWRNGFVSKSIAWATTLVMAVAGVAAIFSLLTK
jgi:NRAMP (natural resistance-associated macrophage protein)-like metal ion transporter